MQHGGLVLLRAGGDDEVGDWYSVVAGARELALCRPGDCQCLGVDAQLVERVKLGAELLVGAGGARAVENLQARDQTEARLPALGSGSTPRASADLSGSSHRFAGPRATPRLVGEQTICVDQCRDSPEGSAHALVALVGVELGLDEAARRVRPVARWTSNSLRSVTSGQRC